MGTADRMSAKLLHLKYRTPTNVFLLKNFEVLYIFMQLSTLDCYTMVPIFIKKDRFHL